MGAPMTKKQVVLVTGPSGAGRSTAINILEDLEFEAIDNLPMGLSASFLENETKDGPIALGLDPRNRDFSTEGFLGLVSKLKQNQEIECDTLYLDCSANVLLHRFSETRRRHHLAATRSVEEGIAHEKGLLTTIKDRADFYIDTSDLNVHQLRAEVEKWFAPCEGRALAISVESFSYKTGTPPGLDMVFDCRFLANPHWVPSLRHLNGKDQSVSEYVKSDVQFQPFFTRVLDLIELLIPGFKAEGKTHLSIGFGCTGGQHRSVTLAETMAKALAADGQQVSTRHRVIERRLKDARPV